MRGRLPSAQIGLGVNGAEEAFWQWRAAISPYFNSVPLVDPRRSAAPPPTCVQYTLGDALLIDTTFPRQVFLRDARWRRQHDDADHLLVQVFLRGGNIVSCGDTEYIERPGGVFAVNLGYETTGVSTDAEVLTLVLPRPWLASAAEGLVDVRGHLFTPGGGAERLLADYMVSLRREASTARRESAPAMAEALRGMLAALSGGDVLASGARTGVLLAIEGWIDANLGDPNLGVATLCQRFRMSRATLFRLFKGRGGVEAAIRGRRLRATLAALADPGRFHQTVFDIGCDHGFFSASHLSRAFRGHFGLTPNEVREAARAAAALPKPREACPDIETMWNWAYSLGRRS